MDQTRASQDIIVSRLTLKVMITGSVLFLFSAFLLNQRLGSETWVNFPFFNAVGASENLLKVILGYLLLAQSQTALDDPKIKWTGMGLITIGFFGFHVAFSQLEPAFFWSFTLGNLLGGLLLNCVWLKRNKWSRAFIDH